MGAAMEGALLQLELDSLKFLFKVSAWLLALLIAVIGYFLRQMVEQQKENAKELVSVRNDLDKVILQLGLQTSFDNKKYADLDSRVKKLENHVFKTK